MDVMKKRGSRETMPYDAAEFLETDEDVAAYLNAALEDGDPALLSAALSDIDRARGMTRLAREIGVTRDGLYKALLPTGNPSFNTVQEDIRASGFKVDVKPTVT